MKWSPISKPRGSLTREPNLTDYEQTRREFAWPQAMAMLDGLLVRSDLTVPADLGERAAEEADVLQETLIDLRDGVHQA